MLPSKWQLSQEFQVTWQGGKFQAFNLYISAGFSCKLATWNLSNLWKLRLQRKAKQTKANSIEFALVCLALLLGRRRFDCWFSSKGLIFLGNFDSGADIGRGDLAKCFHTLGFRTTCASGFFPLGSDLWQGILPIVQNSSH